MRKIIYLFIFFTSLSFSQGAEFKFNINGFTDFIVTPVEGKSAEELYKKTVDWIVVNYKNPKKSILEQTENKFIKLEGFSNKLLLFNNSGKNYYDAKYQIEISFKDGKYKFDVILVNLLNTKSKPEMELNDMSEYYKKDGDLKTSYKYFPDNFALFFNELNTDLKKYILDLEETKKNDW